MEVLAEADFSVDFLAHMDVEGLHTRRFMRERSAFMMYRGRRY